MKRGLALSTVLMASVAAGACAPLMALPAHRPMRPGYTNAPPPVPHRWDLVMSLVPTSIITVLASDGTTHTGRFNRADIRTLYMSENGSQLTIAKVDVIRLDLVEAPRTGDSTGEAVTKGALMGAGAVAALATIPYLLSGDVWVPPARFWVFGAAAGAVNAAQTDAYGRRSRTIYVAPM